MDIGGNITAVNTFGAQGLLSRRTSSGSVFYTFDPQGSVVQRLSSSQAVLSTSLFDAFGNALTSGTGEPWGYGAQAGYYTDTETGLILCTHRYYDPSQGRWLNRDPIGFGGGINLYGYVGNGPVDGVDPSGKFIWVAVGAAAGGGIDAYEQYLRNGHSWRNFNWGECAIAAAGGALGGGVGELIGGLGGTGLGYGLGRVAGNAAANAAISAGQTAATNAVTGGHDSVCHSAEVGGVWGGVGGALGELGPAGGNKITGMMNDSLWNGATTKEKIWMNMRAGCGMSNVPQWPKQLGHAGGNIAGNIASNSGPLTPN